ncbi:MAG: tetratricopeptide repeat protein [Terracidiphilus sp.]
MRRKPRLFPLWLLIAAASAFLLAARPVCAQNGAKAAAAGEPVKAPVKSPVGLATAGMAAADAAAATPDRARAYYHMALGSIYQEEAVTKDRPDLVNKAIEEFKYALDADPDSPELHDELAVLYFNSGHLSEAENTARELLKSDPGNLEAHRLLGRIYLRELSEEQNAPSSVSPPGSVLDKAIAEYAKIAELSPDDIADHMILGQLYSVRHETKKAEEQFEMARQIQPDSEDVVLSLARLYAESDDVEHEAQVIEAVPVGSRTARMEDLLGAACEQLKRPKDAIAAFERAAALDPGDPRTLDALAHALLDDNQLDEALKRYQQLAQADPENADALVHIGEIQRRQGNYATALATIRQALEKDPDNLEAGYNEGLLLDVLGRFDASVAAYQKMVNLTSHANGAYTDDEKNNRGIFLERLGSVYQEQNKTDQAVATYQKMIEMGGKSAKDGYRLQVEAYEGAQNFNKALAVARQAVAANPKDLDMKLMLAGVLGDAGQSEAGLAMAKGLLTAEASKNDQRAVWMALGQMYIRVHRWKDAETALNAAQPLTVKMEDRAYLLFLRGELAERQKHDRKAERYFHQVLKLDPSNSLTLNYLGYMMADRGSRLPEALDLIRKAVQLDPLNGAYLDSLGWVYFKMGMYDLAEENMRQAVQRDPNDPTVHDHMGDLYEKTGRIRQATEQWELSLAEFAKSAPADVDPSEVAKLKKKLESARVKLAKEDRAIGQPKPQQ